MKLKSTNEHVEEITQNQVWQAPGQILEGLFHLIYIYLYNPHNSLIPSAQSVVLPLTVFHFVSQKRQEMIKLTPKEQFVFTLVRLRRNLSLEMLCDMFGIITGTGSSIFRTWILLERNCLK